ncbi:MAG: hypothetical protein J0H62_04995, partial [Rhizobiales bacterium]|nr:hypothetical protein [Hyphomicrobiales bacterium]
MTLLASRLRAAVAVLSVAGAVLLAPGARDAARLLVAQDDPVTLGDLAVGKAFDASRARTEIEDALAAHDADLAVSLLALADARDVAVTQTLRERVRAAGAEDSSAFATAAKFARGFAFGDPRDGAELAGTLTGDLFVYGDVRDIVREGSRIAKGEAADELVLALAGAGLAITAGTYA